MPIVRKQKQTKINKLFRKTSTKPKEPDDCADLLAEVEQLKQKLQEKNNELFQIRRTQNRLMAKLPKMNNNYFIIPDVKEVVLKNKVVSLKDRLEVICMLTSVEVQSYVAGDHCCVVFHMHHDTRHAVKHGLRIDLRGGANEIASSSLPLGFNLAGVMENFHNVMTPNCLSAIRKALFAYYSRLEQYEALKTLVSIGANLFKIIDGSHVEIKLSVRSDLDDDQLDMVLLLDYRVYDIRPKTYAVKEANGDYGFPEDCAAALREQCAVFKKKPLDKAFQQAFVSGEGQYKLASQMADDPAPLPPRRRRARPRARPHHHHDDTFRPEECSGSEYSDEDAIEE